MGGERAPCILQPAPSPGERRLLCQQPSMRASVDQVLVRRMKNMFRHHNLSSKPHSGAFSALLIFWTVSYLHSTGCDARQPLTWKCRNLCFSLSPLVSSNQPIVLTGLPKPIQACVQVGRGVSSSRPLTSIYWKISIMYRFHENKTLHCLPPKRCQKKHTTPQSLRCERRPLAVVPLCSVQREQPHPAALHLHSVSDPITTQL